MHPFPSPYNTGPQACEGLGEAPGGRFSIFVVVSALLHLVVMCGFFHWHGKPANSLIAEKGVIEIDLVSIPAMKKAASVPDEPDALHDETSVTAPMPEASHTPAPEDTITPAAPAIEESPAPVEKQADTPAPVQKEVTAPAETAEIPDSPAPADDIPNNNVLHEAVPSGTATGDSRSENLRDGPGADEPMIMDTTGTFTPGTPDGDSPGASPGQQYVDENFYYVKDLITRNLTYPVVARRMKWQGTVVVSFVVLENGEAENIRIVTGSGHSVLDKNVIATIEQVQPFSAPPATAEFTMPIKYTLRP